MYSFHILNKPKKVNHPWELGKAVKNKAKKERKHGNCDLDTKTEPVTYGMLSSEETMEASTLSVAARRAWLEASSRLRTSSWAMACSGVTS